MPEEPSIPSVLLGLLGGIAIFILGMTLMTQALNSLAGSRMKTLLAAFTQNRFAAALTGAAVTAAVQSSSVTTVLLVGFSSVGLISVTQSAGVIFGANVGSTVTAQIIAFDISEAAAPLLAIGICAHLFKKRERLSQIGLFILGLGAIFFGMEEMSASTHPLRGYEPFVSAMQAIATPGYGILLGFAFTAIVQSSAATIGLVIVFASQGLMTLESAVAVALGANIGTCLTAAIAAIGRPPAAWRVAFLHVFFNVAGVIVWLAFIPQLVGAAAFLSGAFADAPSIAREIAMAHTLFNVANLFLFIGFAGPISRLALRVAPESRRKAPEAAQPLYLDPYYLKSPSLAIDRARLEAGRLATYALRMAEEIPVAALDGTAAQIKALARLDDELDALQTAILAYLARIDSSHLNVSEKAAAQQVIGIVNAWENVGDTLDNHVRALGLDRLDTGLQIGPETRAGIERLHQDLLRHIRLAISVTNERNPEQARALLATKEDYEAIADAVESGLAARLSGRDASQLDLYRLEADLIGNLKRIHHYLRRIARLTLAR